MMTWRDGTRRTLWATVGVMVLMAWSQAWTVELPGIDPLGVAELAAKGHAAGATNAPTQLPPVVVEATRPAAKAERTYTVTNAQTATWTDVPIEETPLSIQIVPRQVIDDQNVVRLRDAYRNVSGVAQEKTQGYAVTFESALVRGFDQRAYVNGVNFDGTPPINLAGVQQVEILKGPSSCLYGDMEVGGLLNIIPKFPEFQPRTEIYSEIGSYGLLRSGVDSTGPLGDNVAYRIVLDNETSDSFRDYVQEKSTFVAPSLTWVFPDQTRLTAWLWYQQDNRPNDDGVAFTSKGQPVEPISMNRAGPDHNSQLIDDVVAGLQLDHNLSESVKLNQKLEFHEFNAWNNDIRFTSATATNNTVTPTYDKSTFAINDMKYVSDALWSFDLGDTKNQMLFGFDLSRLDYLYMPNTAKLTAISIFPPATVINVTPSMLVRGSDSATIEQGGGVFAQEQMDALDNRLHLLAGGRLDYVYQEQDTYPPGKPETSLSQDDLAPSWRAGALYDLTSWVSPYVSVCHSFNPNGPTTNTVGEQPLPPTTGLEYEGGLKFSLFEKKLLLTTAVYQITKNHMSMTDPDNPNLSIDGGKIRSEGFESDLRGQITPELAVIGNYSYTDTRVMESSSLPVGAPTLNVPLNSGSLWLTYTFQDGWLRGLGAGTGVFSASNKSGDPQNSFRLPGYAEMDAGVWYTCALPHDRQLKIQVNVFNVFDKTYYESSQNTGRIEPGAPLSAVAKLSLIF